jgi:6-phosphogluconolactonase/glucosamine-6-phosphate isomerase/deaminase
MKNSVKDYKITTAKETLDYKAPKTHYCLTKLEFDEAVGSDFISYANKGTKNGANFLVGLSHGQSPSGVYQYILDNYYELKNPDLIVYTCINSKLKNQRGLRSILDANSFLKELLTSEKIAKNQIIGRTLDRTDLVNYKNGLNRWLGSYLAKQGKKGLDYVFLASNPDGLVAGITKNSKSFESDKIATVVNDTIEPELTYTPYFLSKTKRIAFLSTKSDKRRTLAWLFYRFSKPNESPSFLRYIDDVENRMTVFIDDHALTWPQIVLKRKTNYGMSSIKIDMAKPYNKENKTKLPVVLMIHGFLGLNTFDGLLAFIPSEKYIAAAMHYGTIPNDLPPKEYSRFVVKNINHVVDYFGKQGHEVYIFDHSIANSYMLMMNDYMCNLKGINKYLSGRIAANPFFSQEAKHASLSFIEEVVLKSKISLLDKTIFQTGKKIMSFQTKKNIKRSGLLIFDWMVKTDSQIRNRIWRAVKQRVLSIISDIDTIPELNRVPLEHTLNRLPVKIFVIQIKSALKESKQLERLTKLDGYEKYNIPTLVLKSERDPIAKFVPYLYEASANTTIVDITNHEETALFKEHLFYMIHPHTTINIIDNFIKEVQASKKKSLIKN